MCPIMLYTDDTSGNKSKKWNKFDCWCLSVANLPLNLARQFSNIHFICCSNSCTALDMAGPIVSELLKLEEGITVYDSHLNCNIKVIAPVICFLADNARASELTNHMGAKALKFCRKCLVCLCICM